MIVKRHNLPFSNNVKGAGFLQDAGNYILTNKDLVAKPILQATGEIGALALKEGVKAIINKAAKNRSQESEEIIKSLLVEENLKKGSGLKRF